MERLLDEHGRYDFPVRMYADDIAEFITQISSSLREKGIGMSYDFRLHGRIDQHHPPLYFKPDLELSGTVKKGVTFLSYSATTDEDDDESEFIDGLNFSAFGVDEHWPRDRIEEHARVLGDTRKTLDDYFANGQRRH